MRRVENIALYYDDYYERAAAAASIVLSEHRIKREE